MQKCGAKLNGGRQEQSGTDGVPDDRTQQTPGEPCLGGYGATLRRTKRCQEGRVEKVRYSTGRLEQSRMNGATK